MTTDTYPELHAEGEYLSIAEAAAACRLGDKAIRAAIKREQVKPGSGLPAFIPGGRDPAKPGRGLGYRIKRSDLRRWFFGLD